MKKTAVNIIVWKMRGEWVATTNIAGVYGRAHGETKEEAVERMRAKISATDLAAENRKKLLPRKTRNRVFVVNAKTGQQS